MDSINTKWEVRNIASIVVSYYSLIIGCSATYIQDSPPPLIPNTMYSPPPFMSLERANIFALGGTSSV